MKTDNIRIKRKNSDFLLHGALYLLLLLVGIFLIGLPFLSFAPNGSGARMFLIVLGVLCVGAGGTLYGMLLYRGLCPLDALIITNRGLTDHLVGGREGVYIEWTNVSSMKIYGPSKSPMLGLSLTDNESYLSHLGGRDIRVAQANLDVGMPIVSIAQRDVFLPIGELKNLFSRMIKGAISWENYNTQGKKPAQPTERDRPEEPQPRSAQPSEPPRPTDGFRSLHAQDGPSQPSEPSRPTDGFRPLRAQDGPETPPQAPRQTPGEETLLFETLSDDEPLVPPETPARPQTEQPQTNDSQEEIVLLDIDND